MAYQLDEDEDLSPYSSIAGAGLDTDSLISSLPYADAPEPANVKPPSVKDTIAARRLSPEASEAPQPMQAPAQGSPQDYSQEPSMKAYEAEQAQVNQSREAAMNRQTEQMKALALGQIASKAARGSSAPESNDEFSKTLSSLSNAQSGEALGSKEKELEGRRKIIEAIEGRRAKTEAASTMQKARAEAAGTMQKVRTGLQQERFDQAAHQRILGRLSNDKQLGQRLTQYQNLSTALSNFANAKDTTPQQVDELQQTIRTNLGIKGAGGVSEREHTYINTLGLNADRLKQFLTGDPASVSKDSKLISHLKDLVKLEQGNIGNQINSRLNAVTAGNSSMYRRRPDLKEDLLGALDAQKAQFDLGNQPSGAPIGVPGMGQTLAGEGQKGGLIPEAQAGSKGGPHGNVVRQNGKFYIWNPDSQKYEPR